MSFVEIANKYGSDTHGDSTSHGTDKNTTHSYGPIYESLFPL
jgi:hypothetical protein